MIVSIASGKGGTGKTTIATNLAVSLEKIEPVQLLDCDVEEPNSHLFIQPRITDHKTVTVAVPEVDEEKCTFCGKCKDICQFKAIAVIADTAVMTFAELCHSCGGCWAVCPEGAVSQGQREVGIIETGHRGDLLFAHGRLRVGEAMAPPLIKQVRSLTDPTRLTIIDAPPGTSCPVIAAMQHTDVVLLVTEPTPFGLHDLELAHAAVQILKIPAGLVINRAGMGNDAVYEYAEASNLPILMELPFDRRIAEAYSNGDLIVGALPEYQDAFIRLYRRLEALAASGRLPRSSNASQKGVV